jgi:hypothetical protein
LLLESRGSLPQPSTGSNFLLTMADTGSTRITALVEQTYLLVERLERISVDSVWSRRSSGHRGALLRWAERFNQPGGISSLSDEEIRTLEALIAGGFKFLERAAAEKSR